MRLKMKRWIGACSVFILLGACGVDDIHKDRLPPEFDECDEAKVDWDAVNALEWTDPLPSSIGYETIDRLLSDIIGEYDVAHESLHGTLTISQSEKNPYEEFSRMICRRMFFMPVHLSLKQGGQTWNAEVDLLVAYEHIGYTTDREVPEPTLKIPAFGVKLIDDIERFPVFGAQEQRPQAPKGEEVVQARITVYIYVDGRIHLAPEIVTTVHGGPEKGGYYASKTWFEIDGERIR